MMSWDEAIGWAVAAAIIGLGLAATIYSQRQYRKTEAEEKRLGAGLDNPEIDEDFAHQMAAGPEAMAARAREKGAV